MCSPTNQLSYLLQHGLPVDTLVINSTEEAVFNSALMVMMEDTGSICREDNGDCPLIMFM